ncbi:MAG: ABC transporter ATP-binding protein [Bacteroidales bacterium]|nr:ABC transporter ATP-binding protein [Bacteroidales bacterium]
MVRRVLNLLLPQERKKLVKVVVSIFINALLDFASLASLMPLLFFLLEGTNEVKAILGFSMIAFLMVSLKGFVSIKLGKYQASYTMSLYKRLSSSLFSNYYNNGLLFIKEQGYSSLGHSVNYMCYTFSQGIIFPLMKILADFLLILLVTVAMLVYEWKTVLVLYLSFLPFMAAYLFFVRDRLKIYAKEDFNAKKMQARIVSDAFRGYQDLEINNSFGVMLKSFNAGLDTISTNRAKMDTLQRIPLFISEFAIIAGFLIMLLIGGGNSSIILGIFAVAAFRLIPALRGILTGYNTIQNSIPCIDVIEKGLESCKVECSNEQHIPFSNNIRVSDLVFNYGNSPINFGSFTIRKGEYVGFRGYSGIGKTTLFNLILGFLSPSEGKIEIDGNPLTPANRASWLLNIGYVPQEPYIFEGTVAQNIALGKEDASPERVLEVLEKVRLLEWVNSLPDSINTTLGEGGSRLSGGQKQRIAIARALYKGARVLLLDEATSSVDIAVEREINTMLCELKSVQNDLTILSIAHRESTLAFCDRIIDLEEVDHDTQV